MKGILFTIVLSTICGLCIRADEAATLTRNSSPNDAGKLGAGIIVGEPTGASLKYWFNDAMAIDGAVGWSSHNNTDLYVHSDVLWHSFDLIPVSKGRLPFYFGVGGLVRFRDNNKDNQAGVRVPAGLSYMFGNMPVDIFAEIGPAIDVTPHTRGEITGGIGIRYWF